MRFYALTLAALWRHIVAEGLDLVAIFTAEDIDPEVLGNESIRLPYDVVDRLRSEAAKQSNNSLS